MPLLPGMSQQPLAVVVHMEPALMERSLWKSWDGEVCLGEHNCSFLLQMPDNPKYLSVWINPEPSVLPYKFSCLQGFVSYLREVPLKSLSDLFAHFNWENTRVPRSSCTFLHSSLTSPYETFKKLLKIEAQPQKHS